MNWSEVCYMICLAFLLREKAQVIQKKLFINHFQIYLLRLIQKEM